MSKMRIVIGALTMLSASIGIVTKAYGINGTVSKVVLNYYWSGIEIFDEIVVKPDPTIEFHIDTGSFVAVSITRSLTGTAPYDFCSLKFLPPSSYRCETKESQWYATYWDISYPEACHLWGASVDDDIWYFDICGEGWFNVSAPSGNTVSGDAPVEIIWDLDTHSNSTCNDVNIWLCHEDDDDSDRTVPLVRMIASHVPNNGSYIWYPGCYDPPGNRYRLCVVCGAATGYSEMFTINSCVSTEQESWGSIKSIYRRYEK